MFGIEHVIAGVIFNRIPLLTKLPSLALCILAKVRSDICAYPIAVGFQILFHKAILQCVGSIHGIPGSVHLVLETTQSNV